MAAPVLHRRGRALVRGHGFAAARRQRLARSPSHRLVRLGRRERAAALHRRLGCDRGRDGDSFATVSTGAIRAPDEARSAQLRIMLRPAGEAPAVLHVDDVSFEPAAPPAPAPTPPALDREPRVTLAGSGGRLGSHCRRDAPGGGAGALPPAQRLGGAAAHHGAAARPAPERLRRRVRVDRGRQRRRGRRPPRGADPRRQPRPDRPAGR